MAEMEGYTIVDPSTVIATHLTEVIKKNAHELLGRQETQELLDKLKEKYPKLVDDVIPGILDLGVVNRVLQALLEGEGIHKKPSDHHGGSSYIRYNKQASRLPDRKSAPHAEAPDNRKHDGSRRKPLRLYTAFEYRTSPRRKSGRTRTTDRK